MTYPGTHVSAMRQAKRSQRKKSFGTQAGATGTADLAPRASAFRKERKTRGPQTLLTAVHGVLTLTAMPPHRRFPSN